MFTFLFEVKQDYWYNTHVTSICSAYPVFGGVHVAQTLVFYVGFSHLLIVLLSRLLRYLEQDRPTFSGAPYFLHSQCFVHVFRVAQSFLFYIVHVYCIVNIFWIFSFLPIELSVWFRIKLQTYIIPLVSFTSLIQKQKKKKKITSRHL